MFAHANVFHFLLNMLALFAFGAVVEEMFSFRMLILFIISGIISGLFSLPFYGSIVGASGAIYGLIGVANVTHLSGLLVGVAFAIKNRNLASPV